MLYEIQTDADFNLEDLVQELGYLELQALGYVKHGDVLWEGRNSCRS
jgi:hypothetical protein